MIEIDKYLYPFDNPVVRRNLGYGPDVSTFSGLIRNYSVAVDGGAMVGRVSNRLATMFDLVIAIELSQENYACLLKNRASNVIAVRACLGETMDAVGYVPDDHPATPVYCVNKEGNSTKGITIDSMNLYACGFIKLDLQGYDLFALKGAKTTLTKFKPAVYLEADPRCLSRYGVKREDIAEYLTPLGYRLAGEGGSDQLWI